MAKVKKIGQSCYLILENLEVMDNNWIIFLECSRIWL